MSFKRLSKTQVLHLAVEGGGFECRTEKGTVNTAIHKMCMQMVNNGELSLGTTEIDNYGHEVVWFHPTDKGFLLDCKEKMDYRLGKGKPLSSMSSHLPKMKEILSNSPDMFGKIMGRAYSKVVSEVRI